MAQNREEELLKMLEIERDEYEQKVKSISDTIQILKAKMGMNNSSNGESTAVTTKNNILDPDYDKDWSISKKIIYLLKREQRFLHNREMSEMTNALEPQISKEKLSKKFSSILSILKKRGLIVKKVINGNNQNCFWGSPKWLNEDGTIKDEFMYNKKYLKNFPKKEELEI